MAGLLTATLKGLRALKNVNTGGRGVSSVATKDFWINPEQISRNTVESGRKLKNGINLRDLPNYQKGDKVIGSNRNTSGNVQHYVRQKDGTLKKYDIDSSGNALLSKSGKTVNANLSWAQNGKNYQNAPVRYDTDTFTKKAYAIGAAGLGGLGYGGYEMLSPDSSNEMSQEEKRARMKNPESVLPDYARSGKDQEAKLKEIRERRAREADPERDLPDYAKSGKGQADPIQPPKAKTNVKPKKPANLNYDPIAEWAREDQATNDKWLKRQAEYKKLVSEGVDPYDAYDRSMQEQPAEPALTANASKPAQKVARPTYTPMSTDQAVDAYRRQHYKNY